MKLPHKIKEFIGNSVLTVNKVGQSPSNVYSFERNGEAFFLKSSDIQYAQTTYSVLREAKMISWVSDKIKVPELVLYESDMNSEFMITKAVKAQPISNLILESQLWIDLYQEILNQLKSVSTLSCPFYSDISSRLLESKLFIDRGLLNQMEDEVESELWGNHQSYLELWQELDRDRVKEKLIFSHGDITDSNIFIDQFDQFYFLDLGRAGLADEFVDIAFVERCLREDHSIISANSFLQQLVYDDPQKRLYFLKLDELN